MQKSTEIHRFSYYYEIDIMSTEEGTRKRTSGNLSDKSYNVIQILCMSFWLLWRKKDGFFAISMVQ